ncbi:hypothetical protein, partial [Pseudomonas aeruginosa]|uniref:hypothetical protein n=1 Tax=Pseudomonas aeruginosa TaxID=287 RepID=UPI0034A0AFC2
MLLPILLLAAAGFTILTTEFVIVGLLPATDDLHRLQAHQLECLHAVGADHR